MLLFKKSIYFGIFSLLISPVFANECIDNIDDHRAQIALFVQGCQLQDEDISKIVNYANNNPEIERLFLSDNDITDKGVEQLSLLNSTIKEIDLSSNKIRGKTLASLRNLNISLLFIHKNPIDSAGIKNLLLNRNITSLWIGSDRFDDELFNSVTNREFDILGIEGNHISSVAWQQIAESSKAKVLFVSGTKENISDNFAEKIAKNHYIEVLSLKNNAISSHGFTSMFNNPNLHGFQTSQLNNSSTFIEPLAKSIYVKSLLVTPEADVILNASIGEYLSKSRSLDTLVLYPDQTHKFSIDADFADAISKTNITYLSSYGYEINDAAAIKLAQSKHLKYLDIESSQISNEGAIALSNNHSLVDLTLCDNKISDQGALAFINNENIESLDLTHNPISKSAAEKLTANSKIKNIKVDLENPNI